MNAICSGPRNIEQKNPLHSAKMMPFIALPYNYLMIMDLLILGPLQVDFSRDAIEHKFKKKNTWCCKLSVSGKCAQSVSLLFIVWHGKIATMFNFFFSPSLSTLLNHERIKLLTIRFV